MPDYSQYPTGDSVELLLKSAKLWPADDTSGVALVREQAAIAARGAADEWERSTGWLPFLSSGEDETQLFSATDGHGLLELESGLLSITSVVVGGRTYTDNVNFWLQPPSARRRKLPYTSLQFTGPIFGGQVYGIPNRIAITGKWGYCDVLPADVWTAIQKYAGVQTLMSIENLQSISSISQDGFNKSYDIVGTITSKDLLTTWGRDWKNHVLRYTRTTC